MYPDNKTRNGYCKEGKEDNIGWMDGWIDEWMDGWMWMDEWVDGWNGMDGMTVFRTASGLKVKKFEPFFYHSGQAYKATAINF